MVTNMLVMKTSSFVVGSSSLGKLMFEELGAGVKAKRILSINLCCPPGGLARFFTASLDLN